MDEDVLDDPRIATVQERHGPLAIAAWVFVLTTAKKQNNGGRVELSPIILARSVGVSQIDAEDVIEYFMVVGLIEDENSDERRYAIPKWETHQGDQRTYADRLATRKANPGRKPGRPRKQPLPEPEMASPFSETAKWQEEKRREEKREEDPRREDPRREDPRGHREISSAVAADADSISECDHLADWIERNGGKRPTVTKGWLQAADRLKRIDGRTHEQVMAAIDWCQRDAFWSSNVLSMPKLREKYDQLRLQAARSPQGQTQSRQESRSALAERLMQETGEGLVR